MVGIQSAGGHVRPWSFSRLSTAEQCPKQYWYSYIEKVPSTKPESPAAARGLGIHEKAEKYLLGEIPIYPPELQKVAAHAMMLKAKKAKPETKLGVKADWSPCDFKDPDAYFRGIIDVSYIEGGVIHVQDWKSGQVYSDHPEQLAQYSALVAAHHPEATDIHTRLIYTDSGVVTKPKVTPMGHIKGIRIMLDARIKKVEEETIYPVQPGKHCQWCDYSTRYGGPCPH
jgi:hypothetical protein